MGSKRKRKPFAEFVILSLLSFLCFRCGGESTDSTNIINEIIDHKDQEKTVDFWSQGEIGEIIGEHVNSSKGSYCGPCAFDSDCQDGWACMDWADSYGNIIPNVSWCGPVDDCISDSQCGEYICQADANKCEPKQHLECDTDNNAYWKDSCGNWLDLAEECTNSTICQNGKCVCTPNCTDKQCGNDGCGGSCGTCQDGYKCENYKCVPTCVKKTCSDYSEKCGSLSDTCGGMINCTCSGGKVCLNGNCCQPNCSGKECGADGCSGVCGTCATNEKCENYKCVQTVICGNGKCDAGESYCNCPNDCSNDPLSCESCECGDNGGDCYCDEICLQYKDCCIDACDNCGQCSVCGNAICEYGENANNCSKDCGGCVPSCIGKVCGDNGCGGSCGTCQAGYKCENGECVEDVESEFGESCEIYECDVDLFCMDWTGVGGELTCGKLCNSNSDCPETCCGPYGIGGELVCTDPLLKGKCPQVCGNGKCEAGENKCNCSSDCWDSKGWTCDLDWWADDFCDCDCGKEDSCDCAPAECGCQSNCTGKVCGDDGCGGSCGTCQVGYKCENYKCVQVVCGNGKCDAGESYCNCPKDCTNDPLSCEPCECGEKGGNCYCDEDCLKYKDCCINACDNCGYCSVCGNAICEYGENANNCSKDCGGCISNCTGKVCGDDGCGGSCGTCQVGYKCENYKCVQTVICGNGKCESGENSCNCNGDCPGCCTTGDCPPTCFLKCLKMTCVNFGCECVDVPNCCGNDLCEVGENSSNCPDDCGPCVPNCTGKDCGDNGCGGSCGTCNDNNKCTTDSCLSGICMYSNVPDGTGCGAQKTCLNGACQPYCNVNGICDANENPCYCPLDCPIVLGKCAPCSCGGQGPGGACWCTQACLANYGNCCDNVCSVCGVCAKCGNGSCDFGADESHCNCPGDCPIKCGDGCCSQGETCSSCQADCGNCGIICGNGECESGENCTNCVSDCACSKGTVCVNGACCTPNCTGKVCGDDGCGGSCGTCQAGYNCENYKCVQIVTCGNKKCEAGENSCNCKGDCPGCCTTGDCPSCDTCKEKTCTNYICGCKATTPCCGNGSCEAGENPCNCPSDNCSIKCGDGCCSSGETSVNCPGDCGACVKKTCSDYSGQCGTFSDGCGNNISCTCANTCCNGICCSAGQKCYSNSCCTPKTCSGLGKECGSWSDTCGGTVNCPSCSAGKTCDANGKCVTVCTPKTCADYSGQCGTFSDGCGNNINCACSGGKVCNLGICCTPTCSGKCKGASDKCGGTCPVNNCTGCCTETICKVGTTKEACGKNGNLCMSCTKAPFICSKGECVCDNEKWENNNSLNLAAFIGDLFVPYTDCDDIVNGSPGPVNFTFTNPDDVEYFYMEFEDKNFCKIDPRFVLAKADFDLPNNIEICTTIVYLDGTAPNGVGCDKTSIFPSGCFADIHQYVKTMDGYKWCCNKSNYSYGGGEFGLVCLNEGDADADIFGFFVRIAYYGNSDFDCFKAKFGGHF